MAAIRTPSECARRMDQIRLLKNRLWILASQRGNLDPDVIRMSQEIDEHIVAVQRFWLHHQESLTG